jgi:hypothetical protein
MIAEKPLANQNGGFRRGPVRRLGYDPLRSLAPAGRHDPPALDSVVRCQDWVVAGSWGREPDSATAGFAERLLEVVDSGRRTATYKLALLMALLDLCARRGGLDGRPPSVLCTRDIAERVAARKLPKADTTDPVPPGAFR